RHPLARRDRERHRLRIAVEQVHVARAARERARRVYAITDVLHAAQAVAGHDEPRLAIVESKAGDPLVLSMKDPGLAVRGGRRQAEDPSAQALTLLPHHAADRGAVSELDRAPQLGVGEGIDLYHHEPATTISRSPLPAKGAIFQTVVPPKQAPSCAVGGWT